MKNIENINYPAPKQEYKVLVRCFTFNHAKYIEETLNGFTMQQTNFPFVCLIMDDASTDGEQEVIKEWMERECDMCRAETIDIPTSNVIIVPHKTNLFCTFAFYLFKQNLYEAKEKKILHVAPWRKKCEYEAICEGDDYWVEPLKLQEQVIFLDNHPNYSFCCHRFQIYQQNSDTWLKEYADNFYKNNENLEISIDLLFRTWVTQPLTAVYRLDCYQKIDKKLFTYKYLRDVHLFYHLLKVGKGTSLNKIMGVYRWHDGGIASSLSFVDKLCVGYKIYKELYLQSKDKKVFKVFVGTGVALIKHRNYSSEAIALIKEMWSCSSNVNDKVRLIFLLLAPDFIVRFISFIKKKLLYKF